ncbi:MAG: SUMF1/EgtB/PvdO family nonheme iron enzyme [Gammaproteobacteria bacterium]
MMTFSLKTKFLPFDRFHQAPITGVSRNAICQAAKEMLRLRSLKDRENIRLETAQNHICKALGFSGGFAGFGAAYRDSLKPFMERNALVTLRDLVTHVGVGGCAFWKFRHRQLADRLFQDDLKMPGRIFTGTEVDLLDLLRFAWTLDGYSVRNRLSNVAREPDSRTPEASYVISRSDTILGFQHISVLCNMLGDQCFDYGCIDQPIQIVPKIYFSKNVEEPDWERDEYDKAGLLFRDLLLEMPTGWLDIIPYNKDLVFLRGPNGTYDFVFRGMRDTPFEHNPYVPFLKNADIPKTGSRYDFNRWLYFPANSTQDSRNPYDGWLERDEHEAEKAFYAVGGSARSHPGENLLLQHLSTKGTYQPLSETSGESEGFYESQIDGEISFVSNLVTIGEFRHFMEQNTEYRDYSRSETGVDDWKPVNTDDEKLPASATWYDAMAYTAWVSKVRKLPVRLLTEHEFRAISSPLIPRGGQEYFDEFVDNPSEWNEELSNFYEQFNQDCQTRLCRFERMDGARYPEHPPYMSGADFDRLVFKFNPDAIVWKKAQNGLRFLSSPFFGEWLQPEAAAVSCYHLASIASMPGCMAAATRERFAAGSTGKYKSFKIGFRLIYKAI